jgi:tetratricopeptide (TPR) repeat protein
LAGTSGRKDEDTLHFYLGQLNEAKQDEAAALTHYRQIKGGERHYDAQLRVAYLLHKQGQVAQAREVLQHLQPGNDAQRVQLLLIEAQFLRDAAQYAESFKVLTRGLAKFPDQPDLLYQAALVADKLKQYDTFEQLIRKLNDALGATSLMVTHDVQESLLIVDYIYFISQGQIVAEGTPDEIRASKDPFVHQFVHAEVDGPVHFDYPAPSIAKDFMPGVKRV